LSSAVDVIYLFEHGARELDVACAVTSLLRARGVRTEVVQWPYGFHRVAHLPTPAVVLLPFCYTESSYATCLLEWREATYFNLSWEQLFYSGNSKAKSPRGNFARRHVLHHAWSDVYAEWLRERDVPPEHIVLNGQPAYALYDEPYQAYFDSRPTLAARHALDEDKRWVFFPENYNWAFYSKESLRRFVAAGQDERQIREMKEYCDVSLREVLHWCADAARDGGMEIVIRPRPATPLADFRRHAEEVLGALPAGLRIIQDGTVREWIRASDTIVSSQSTSLIEGSIAGKPVFMLRPVPLPAALAVDWHRFVKTLGSKAEFERACSRGTASESGASLAAWARDRMMARGDSIRNLADHITALVRGNALRPPVVSRADAAPKGILGRLGVPRALAYEWRRRRHRERRRRASLYIEREYAPDIASEREVESRIERWTRLLLGAAPPAELATR
jgi:surface carbohydrate biosynthesis protein